ncbi:unnamed protein product [Linum trigynum]|uniref:Uncharacterized protein n=1 Tax=Linum trigynum TaxID=586398 RepID=A0AAV2F908_9ROSI
MSMAVEEDRPAAWVLASNSGESAPLDRKSDDLDVGEGSLTCSRSAPAAMKGVRWVRWPLPARIAYNRGMTKMVYSSDEKNERMILYLFFLQSCFTKNYP